MNSPSAATRHRSNAHADHLGRLADGDQLQRFLSIVQDPTKQPVLVHCAQGVRRTGMMVAAYQRSVLNYSADQAKPAADLRPQPRTVGDVQRFIDVYDPAARQMTRKLEVSKE